MNEPVNLFAPHIRSNPYPIYARLRAAPIQRVDPGGFWAVTRYEDVEYVLKTPELFSNAGFAALFKPDWLPHNPIGDSVGVKDGAAHAKLRALLSRAFTPRAIARMEPRIRAIVVELAEHMARAGELDFVADFCAPLPARVIAEILGIDPALHGEFKRWVNHILSITPVYPGDEMASAIRRTVSELEGYLKEVLAARRRAPLDDIVSDLTRVTLDGNALTDDDIIAFLFALVVAGFETTMHLLGNVMVDLTDRPDEHERLRADRSRVPDYVEEMLRKEPPAHGIMRMTTTEVELGGVRIPAGSMVMVLLASANHDEKRFPEPERVDVARGSQGGFAFGYGVHFCMGAPLARLEARVAIEELTARFRRFERLPGELTWNLAVHVRGLTALGIRVVPM